MDKNSVIYIIDDDQAVRDSLVWLVESVGIETKAFASATDFLEAFDDSLVACIIADLRMPGMSGLALQQELTARNIQTPFILMTAFGEVATAVKAMKAGAADFIEKPFKDQDMLDLINASLEEERIRLQDIQQRNRNTNRIASLTARESKVFALVAQGKSNKLIAQDMGISIKTVEVHRARVMRKLGLNSVAELVQLFLKTDPD